jgi:hypothetical protein
MLPNNKPLHVPFDHGACPAWYISASPARHSRRPCAILSSNPPWHRTQATLAQTLTRESAWLLFNQVSTYLQYSKWIQLKSQISWSSRVLQSLLQNAAWSKRSQPASQPAMVMRSHKLERIKLLAHENQNLKIASVAFNDRRWSYIATLLSCEEATLPPESALLQLRATLC